MQDVDCRILPIKIVLDKLKFKKKLFDNYKMLNKLTNKRFITMQNYINHVFNSYNSILWPFNMHELIPN